MSFKKSIQYKKIMKIVQANDTMEGRLNALGDANYTLDKFNVNGGAIGDVFDVDGELRIQVSDPTGKRKTAWVVLLPKKQMFQVQTLYSGSWIGEYDSHEDAVKAGIEADRGKGMTDVVVNPFTENSLKVGSVYVSTAGELVKVYVMHRDGKYNAYLVEKSSDGNYHRKKPSKTVMYDQNGKTEDPLFDILREYTD